MTQRYLLFSILIFLLPVKGFSQGRDSTATFKISGYVDAYYGYYTDSVGTNNYQKFPDISPKSNQFGLNIAQLSAQYTSQKVRAVATFHYGDIPSSAWSPVFNMIQEANAGIRLRKKLWLDAGLFKTHIGTEALLPKDNITSSLSVITLYEPWWQAGIRLSYLPTDKLLICLHILNGYNTYIDNNRQKSFGLTLLYTFNDNLSLGYYNLLGEESNEGAATTHFRTLHNLVLNYQVTKKLKAVVGLDYITQQHSALADTTKTASVYSGIITLKYQFLPAFGMYVRGETFNDPDGFLAGAFPDAKNKYTGYKLNGATLGFEYKPLENAFIRLEGRDLMMDKDQKIFRTDGANTNNRIEATVNIGVWF